MFRQVSGVTKLLGLWWHLFLVVIYIMWLIFYCRLPVPFARPSAAETWVAPAMRSTSRKWTTGKNTPWVRHTAMLSTSLLSGLLLIKLRGQQHFIFIFTMATLSFSNPFSLLNASSSINNAQVCLDFPPSSPWSTSASSLPMATTPPPPMSSPTWRTEPRSSPGDALTAHCSMHTAGRNAMPQLRKNKWSAWMACMYVA